MTYQDKRLETRPKSGEAPFHLDEVFFSRTDDRGVISSGNYVFHRVAGYDWAEMLGAPHKIIRHPDMPKAVFWLLWDTLKRGEAVGAYVKNRAKDGLYYWVFAVVVPCEGGYLSARIKPTSATRDLIEKEYATLLKAEAEGALSPKASAQLLLGRLNTLGFSSYNLFATYALGEELIARGKGLNKAPDQAIAKFRKMLSSAESLGEETAALIQEFEAMRTIPHNLRVIASRLEPTGGPVSTLSKNYGIMSQDMSDWFESHVVGPDSNFSTIKSSVNDSMFLECMARILISCDKQLTFERRKLGEIDLEAERAILKKTVAKYVAESNAGLRNVGEEADRILRACNKMNRHVLGLSTTRVMCKIESARLTDTGDGLTDIISQLMVFQERISQQLDRIAQLSGSILTAVA